MSVFNWGILILGNISFDGGSGGLYPTGRGTTSRSQIIGKTLKDETRVGLPTVPEWPGQSRN